jgi:ribonuclease P protein component
MLGRLLRSADFESVLATPIKARSAHFAAHHLPSRPTAPKRRRAALRSAELSTADQTDCPQAVEDRSVSAPADWWLGIVVPKRHAARATTRNLLRRQIRGAMARHHFELPRGIWLVRLRAPFEPRSFRSATSSALRDAVVAELDGLLSRAAT